jgi:hypothetical protein
MAVVSLKSPWVNNDGLAVQLPGDAGTVKRWGEVQLNGRHCIQGAINLAALPTAASGDEQIQSETVIVPSGALIEQVDVLVTKEPTTSGSPNLDLGLVRTDRTTELDYNGLLAATDTWETGTDLGAFVSYVKGSTEAGALIGTRLTNAGLITASPDTADWTAGVIIVRVYFSFVNSADV